MIAPFNSDQRVIVTSPPKKTIRPTKKGGNLSGHLPSPKFSAFKFSAHYICQSELLLILILSWEDKCTWSYFNRQGQRKRQIEIFLPRKTNWHAVPIFFPKNDHHKLFSFFIFFLLPLLELWFQGTLLKLTSLASFSNFSMVRLSIPPHL